MLEAYYAYTDRLEDIGRARNRQRAWKNSQHKSSMMYIKKFSEFKISSIDAISKLAGVAPAAIGAAGNVTTEGITTVAEGAKNVLTVIQIGTKALSITASLVRPSHARLYHDTFDHALSWSPRESNVRDLGIYRHEGW
jgi:hypothetical protein